MGCHMFRYLCALPSYRNLAVHAAGAVEAKAEALKEKYADLLCTHVFVTVVVETCIWCFWASNIEYEGTWEAS